jgi:hypothetical protein
MAAGIGAQQNALSAGMQQTWQAYLQAYGPWLQQQYAQSPYRNQMSFEQFAYSMMMTANGTNIAGAQQAQQNQFAGNQAAHNTVEEGNQDFNAGSAADSQATTNAVEGFDQGAVRGNSAEVDPQTGQTEYLPYTNIQDNQPFAYNGQTYVHNGSGYYELEGGNWVPVQGR